MYRRYNEYHSLSPLMHHITAFYRPSSSMGPPGHRRAGVEQRGEESRRRHGLRGQAASGLRPQQEQGESEVDRMVGRHVSFKCIFLDSSSLKDMFVSVKNT